MLALLERPAVKHDAVVMIRALQPILVQRNRVCCIAGLLHRGARTPAGKRDAFVLRASVSQRHLADQVWPSRRGRRTCVLAWMRVRVCVFMEASSHALIRTPAHPHSSPLARDDGAPASSLEHLPAPCCSGHPFHHLVRRDYSKDIPERAMDAHWYMCMQVYAHAIRHGRTLR
jgi:hypothetical protein